MNKNTEGNTLAIAYRIYPSISKKPLLYQNNKLKLSELCLKSFKESLGDLNVKIWAILDNCPIEYENLFHKYFNEDSLQFVRFKKRIGNKNTFLLQLKILKEQKFSKFVYLAEDDYYYLPNQFKQMISFLKNDPEADFITPYDHMDQYTLKFHNYKSKIKVTKSKHWRTIYSTCCTFLTTKERLTRNLKIFQMYLKKKTTDLSIWVCLTKYKVFNPFFIIKFLFIQPDICFSYYKAWMYGWRQILFGRKWNLWCPIPTIGTHMEDESLSPTINWKKIFQKEIKKIK
ncbi:MAG: glycosyltransferase family 2 protein [Promethearchaeota archaeon]